MDGANKKPEQKPRPVTTAAGQAFMEALTEWLQDTRLMSEAVYRLSQDKAVKFDARSWPKKRTGKEALPFEIRTPQLNMRMTELLNNLWRTRFIFLESLWEEYLQELVIELRHLNASIYEPFCERDFMTDILREVLSNRLDSIESIKDEVAVRFAAGLTRQSWTQQWKQLARLEIGLADKDRELEWFPHLDAYFEIRNCIVHRRGRVSDRLNKIPHFYDAHDKGVVNVWPPHLDFYRHQFIKCLLHIEDKIRAKHRAAE